MKLVITGGHHSSALPVIKEIHNNYHDIDIFWFGHRYSQLGNKADTLEYIEITSLGIPFYDLKAGKFYKTKNIIRLLKIPYGFFQALLLLLKIKPDVILSFGGYLAVPTVLAGWFLGIPSITHEQTLVTGYANKVISIFSKKILISWQESKDYFKSEKVVFTGLPLRDEIFNPTSNNFKVNASLPVIYITAGKTGSHKINMAVKDALVDLLSKYNIIHQCGDHSEYEDFDELNSHYNNIKNSVEGKYISRKFIFNDEIGEAFNKADLVISRAGAHTIRELYALKIPSLLIPIPWVSHNEQEKNAQFLVSLGIAEILDEYELGPDTLISRVNDMMSDISKYKLEGINEEIAKEKPEKLIIKEVLSCSKQSI